MFTAAARATPSRLAQAVREALPGQECLYFGPPDEAALEAQTVYAGFWTDKGSCDEEMARFLKRLTDQRVFLFGTAGFGGAPAYFEQILGRVRENLAPTVSLLGEYMCQGKMPQPVRERYEAMEAGSHRDAMLENFDRAKTHPDAAGFGAAGGCRARVRTDGLPESPPGKAASKRRKRRP